MKRITLLFIASATFLLNISMVHAQSCFFAHRFYSSGFDGGGDLVIDKDNNVIFLVGVGDTMDVDPGAGVTNIINQTGYSGYVCKFSNNGALIWAKQPSLSAFTNIAMNHVTTDASGNIYIMGTLSGTADFDLGSGTYNLTSTFGSFIWKLNSSGNFVYAKIFDSGVVSGQKIKALADGTLYITGFYAGSPDMDPGAGVQNLTTNGNQDIFLLKLNSNGIYQWAIGVGGTDYDDALSLAVDAMGNACISGRFSGSVDFDPSPLSTTLNGGVMDNFLAKYSASGALQFARHYPSASLKGLAIDASGNIYSGGAFNTSVDFDLGSGTYILSPNAGSDAAYVTKLNSAGDFQWVKHFTGSGNSGITALITDNNDNIVIRGYAIGSIDYDPGTGYFPMAHPAYFSFFAKLNTSGDFISAKALKGTENAGVVDVDVNNNVFASGMYNNANNDFDPDTTQVLSFPANPDMDLYMVKFPSLQGAITSFANNNCKGGTSGSAIATGYDGASPYIYSWNSLPTQTNEFLTDVAGGVYTVTVTDANGCVDHSVVEITEPEHSLDITVSKSDETCVGNDGEATVTVSGGITQYSIAWNTNPIESTPTISNLVAGNYVVEVSDSNNCIKRDSVLLIKESNPSSFTYTTSGLVASFSIAGIGCNSFVWDFGNGNTSSINPNPTVTYATAGTYGVCLQCNGQPSSCVQCINISVPSTTGGGVGIEETENAIGISVYPNPSNDFITIENKSGKLNSIYVIVNSLGQHLLTGKLTADNAIVDVSRLQPGFYLLQVGVGDMKSFKLVKK